MPEIIKPGKLPGNTTYTVTCNSCKCVMRVKRSECTYSPDQRDAGHLIVSCAQPGCNCEVFFHAEKCKDKDQGHG